MLEPCPPQLKVKVEERVGFEPTDPCESLVFKTRSFNHSDISPIQQKETVSFRNEVNNTISFIFRQEKNLIF